MMVFEITQRTEKDTCEAQFIDFAGVLRFVSIYQEVVYLLYPIGRVRFIQFVGLLSFSVVFVYLFGCDALARENLNIRKASRFLEEGQFSQAYVLYQKEARAEDPVALFTLGLFELNGWGRPQDEHAACTWFQKAAYLDVPMAALYMGDCLTKGMIEDTEKKFPQYWYKRAIDLGLSQAWCSLGKLHLHDRFVSYDLDRAIELCERSAESGIISAQVAVAKMILQSATENRDLEKVRFWLEQASMNGDKEAQFMFAEHLASLAQNDGLQEEILQLYQQSALQGYLSAYGPTGQLNYEIALKSDSQDERTGALSRAYFWLLLLKESGDTDLEMKYKETLKILADKLDPELTRRISNDVSSQQKFLEEQ